MYTTFIIFNMPDIVFRGITIPFWVFIILVIIGLVMAFFGRAIWDVAMSMIGGLIGSMIGFVVGFMLAEWIGAIICMFIFGFIGSILFRYLVRVALALLCGLIVAALIWLAAGGPPLADFLIFGLIIMIIVFIPSYYFIEELVSVLTALIGGSILGVGVYGLTLNPWLAIGLGVLAWIFGSLVQIMALEKYDRVADAT
jgi:hypothetical protein